MNDAIAEMVSNANAVQAALAANRPSKAPKRLKFEELATARVERVIKAMRVLARMGGTNRYAYDFSSADVEKIACALEEEIKMLRVRMHPPGHQMDVEFDFGA